MTSLQRVCQNDNEYAHPDTLSWTAFYKDMTPSALFELANNGKRTLPKSQPYSLDPSPS